MTRPRTAVLLLAVGAVTGCSDPSQPDVQQAATAFSTGDAATRCAMLAPESLASLEREEEAPCEQAVEELPLGSGDVVSVEVWGEDALVHLTDDTLFLTRTDGGWQVSAAACEPRPEAPYVCQLEAS